MTDVNGSDFTSYDGLVDLIALWIDRPDLIGVVPLWIRLTESELQRDLFLLEQEKVKEGTLSTSDDFITLPDDYLFGKMLRLDTDPLRVFNTVSTDKWIDVRQNRSGDSSPSAVTQHGNRLYLAPTPSAADPYTLWYTGRILPLSKENQSNRLLEDAPDALLYCALKHAAPFIQNDERLPVWLSFAESAKASYKAVNWRARTSSGTLTVRPDVGAGDRHYLGNSNER